MDSQRNIRSTVGWFLVAVAALTAACSSTRSVPRVKPGHGLVRIAAPGETNISWQVQRLDPKEARYRVCFSELEPQPEVVVALPSGPQQLRITALNRVVIQPAVIEVTVTEERPVFVRVVLQPVAEAAVQTRIERYRPTFRGGIRRAAEYGSEKSVVYELSASIAPE
jgi:hypothetical protein